METAGFVVSIEGRPLSVSVPYTATAAGGAYLTPDTGQPGTRYTYDAEGQVVRVEKPDGSQVQTAYRGWSAPCGGAGRKGLGRVSYYPFGEVRSQSGQAVTDRLYTGQRLSVTGLYHFGAREYDPLTGRFLSPDPFPGFLAAPQSLNPYAYVGNNPVNMTDPSGLHPPTPFSPLNPDPVSMFWAVHMYQNFKSAVDAYTAGERRPGVLWLRSTGLFDSIVDTGNRVYELNQHAEVVFSGAPLLERVYPAVDVGWWATKWSFILTPAGIFAKNQAMGVIRPNALPPNGGGLGPWSEQTLPEGFKLSRYGAERGSYVCGVDVPFEERALPGVATEYQYSEYTVEKPLEVESSVIRPWYGMKWGRFRIQQKLPKPINQLLEEGYLRRNLE